MPPSRFSPPLVDQLDIRPTNSITPGCGADRPEYEAWAGFRDATIPRAPGPWGSAAVVMDSLAPNLLARSPTPRLVPTVERLVPTVELCAHFAPGAASQPKWYFVRHVTVWANETACVDETEVRDRNGDPHSPNSPVASDIGPSVIVSSESCGHAYAAPVTGGRFLNADRTSSPPNPLHRPSSILLWEPEGDVTAIKANDLLREVVFADAQVSSIGVQSSTVLAAAKPNTS